MQAPRLGIRYIYPNMNVQVAVLIGWSIIHIYRYRVIKLHDIMQ